MDSIQINLKTPTQGISELKYLNIILNDDKTLTVTIADSGDTIGLTKGMVLTFNRYIYDEKGNTDSITGFSQITDIVGCNIIITQPLMDMFEIYKTYSAITIDNKHIIELGDNHNVFLQDLGKQKLYFHDFYGNIISDEQDINIIFKREDILVTSADCITNSYTNLECGVECNDQVTIFEYTHTPERFSRNAIVVSSIPDGAFYVSFKYNPFYYIDENNECKFWEDDIWKAYEDLSSDCIKYINNGNSKVSLSRDDSYWNVGVGLSSDSDENKLGSEDTFNSLFIDDLKESLVPEIIDMERLKYSPVIIDEENNVIPATSITLNFHFRERKVIDDIELNTSKSVYYDSWNIDLDNETTIWWNGFNNDNNDNYEFDSDRFKRFYENSGLTSDLLGYLNFTDNDVFYQKKKISKSFVRLSFYSSTDPIEQKLLYFSTVFLDGGALYGKYLKQLSAINEGLLKPNAKFSDSACRVVFTQSGTPVDSKIVITNEFDRTKSSEGFNIYLFGEDSKFIFENGEKTIYMKVEFNHAGNGKTIPMIAWPQTKDGDFIPLNINNFIDNLYIPITLKYIDGKYVYVISKSIINNGNVDLILFEPKLDVLSDDNAITVNYTTKGAKNNFNGKLYLNPGVNLLNKLPNTKQTGYDFTGWKIKNSGEEITKDFILPEIESGILEIEGTYQAKTYEVKIIGDDFNKIYELKYNDIIYLNTDEDILNYINGVTGNNKTVLFKINNEIIDLNEPIIITGPLIITIEISSEIFILSYYTEGIYSTGIIQMQVGENILKALKKIEKGDITWYIDEDNDGKGDKKIDNDSVMPNKNIFIVGTYSIGDLTITVNDSKHSEPIKITCKSGDILGKILTENAELQNRLNELENKYYTSFDVDSNKIITESMSVNIILSPKSFGLKWKINRPDFSDSGIFEVEYDSYVLPKLNTLEPFYKVEGYTFSGWFSGESKITSETKMPAYTLEVEGRYNVETYNVTIKEKTGKFSASFSFEKGTTFYTILYNSNSVTEYINSISEGYVVKYLINNKDINLNNTLNEDTTIIIELIPGIFTFTFKNEDEIIEKQDKTFGEKLVYPIPEKKEGYTFVWADNEKYNGQLIPAKNLTIIGKYEINKYTVRVYDMSRYLIFDKKYDYGTSLNQIYYEIENSESYKAYVNSKEGYEIKLNTLDDSEEAILESDLDLTVSAKAKKITLTFIDTTNNEKRIISTTGVTYGETITYPSMDDKTIDGIKYTFNWKDSSWNGKPMPSEPLTIEGSYSTNQCVLYWEIKGDKSSTGSKNLSDGDNIKANLPSTNEEGYTYTKWTINGKEIGNNDTMKAGSNITAICECTVNKWSINWSLDGGNSGEIPDVEYGRKILSLFNDITTNKDGYTFSGWYMNNVKVDNNTTMPDKDITVEGRYGDTQSYKLIYSTTGSNNNLNSSISVSYGANISDILKGINTEQTGYVFNGWTLKNGGAIPSTMPANDLEIVGTYTAKTYTLSWSTTGGDKDINGNKTISYGTNLNTVIQGINTLQIGYDFSGWTLKNGGAIPSTMPANDLEIVGTYTAKTYTLSWSTTGSNKNLNGSKDVPYKVNVYNCLPETTQTGYIFGGWYSGGETITTATTMPPKDLSVQGEYTKEEVKIDKIIFDFHVYLDKNTKVEIKNNLTNTIYIGPYNNIPQNTNNRKALITLTYAFEDDVPFTSTSAFTMSYKNNNIPNYESGLIEANLVSDTAYLGRRQFEFNTNSQYVGIEVKTILGDGSNMYKKDNLLAFTKTSGKITETLFVHPLIQVYPHVSAGEVQVLGSNVQMAQIKENKQIEDGTLYLERHYIINLLTYDTTLVNGIN